MEHLTYGDQINLLPHPSEVLFYPAFFTAKESDVYLPYLMDEIPWIQEPVELFGKLLMQPRLTAFFGDEGMKYNYADLTMEAESWSTPLLKVKEKVEEKCETSFNICLLHYYRNGKDHKDWHRDNEHSFGQFPIIASLSFGTTRIFQFRNYQEKIPVISLELEDGSLLLMRGETQKHWEHRLPKTALPIGPYINLNFGQVVLK